MFIFLRKSLCWNLSKLFLPVTNKTYGLLANSWFRIGVVFEMWVFDPWPLSECKWEKLFRGELFKKKKKRKSWENFVGKIFACSTSGGLKGLSDGAGVVWCHEWHTFQHSYHGKWFRCRMVPLQVLPWMHLTWINSLLFFVLFCGLLSMLLLCVV